MPGWRYWSLVNVWTAFPLVQSAEIIIPIFPGSFWSHGQIIAVGISLFREVVPYSRFFEFHSCHYPGIIMTIGEDYNNDQFEIWQLLSFLKSPVLLPQSNNVHAKPIYFINPCFNLLVPLSVTSWILTQCTWTSLPAVEYSSLLATCTALGFWRDIMPGLSLKTNLGLYELVGTYC